MGKIKILKEEDLVGVKSNEDIYPVTHSLAVFDKNKRNLQNLIDTYDESVADVSVTNNTLIVTKNNGDNKNYPISSSSSGGGNLSPEDKELIDNIRNYGILGLEVVETDTGDAIGTVEQIGNTLFLHKDVDVQKVEPMDDLDILEIFYKNCE